MQTYSFLTRVRRHAPQSRVGSLILLLQRSPIVKFLLPEARVMTATGVNEALKWSVTAVAGLGAFDSVAGATAVVQVTPTQNAPTANYTAGAPLFPKPFLYQMTGGGGHVPATFTLFSGTLPTGLTRANIQNSTTDYITGAPTQVGSFPITLRAWENSGGSGRFASGSFTLIVTAPPAPTLTALPSPPGGTLGSFVKLAATQSDGQTFVWRKDGALLTPTATPAPAATVILPRTATRKWIVPASDIGTAWRTNVTFADTGWNTCAGGIGYDKNTTVDFRPSIAAGGTITTASASPYPTTAYVRMLFTIPSTVPAFTTLKFRFQCDDGYMAYLNGTNITNLNEPVAPAYNSSSSTGVASDTVGISWQEITLSPAHTALLTSGTNLLAIQALNQSNTSSDMLFNCEIAGVVADPQSPTLFIPSLTLAHTGSYTLKVGNFTNPTGVTSAAAAVHILPEVATSPQGSTINAGQTAQLSVTATGSSLAYQWYEGAAGDTSHPVSGATSAAFTTPALNASSSFWVRVSNPSGFADSSAAAITVNVQPPGIIGQPGSSTINRGSTATLSVSASGDGISFQWYTGTSGQTAAPVSGATSPSFTTPALTATTSYWVRISNAAGSVDSNTATLSVIDNLDGWREAKFTPAQLANPAVSGPSADPDGDGIPNEQEYIFGTGPLAFNTLPEINPTVAGGTLTLSFPTITAGGGGYSGRARVYSLDSSDSLTSGSWQPVPGAQNLPATGGTVSHPLTAGTGHRYFRLRVSLTP